MSHRSDRQYNADNKDLYELYKGEPKKSPAPESWQEREKREAALKQSRPIRELQAILSMQLPLFKKEGNRYTRTYHAGLINFGNHVANGTYCEALGLFVKAGLPLEHIACTAQTHPKCATLQAFAQTMDEWTAKTLKLLTTHKKSVCLAELDAAGITVSLSEQQFTQLRDYYRGLLEKPGLSQS